MARQLTNKDGRKRIGIGMLLGIPILVLGLGVRVLHASDPPLSSGLYQGSRGVPGEIGLSVWCMPGRQCVWRAHPEPVCQQSTLWQEP
jgi:hypothetical protein